jgi:16S rRNA (adenine1518-N6/adenine1519-N6)-dimethyltransferase
MGQSLGQHFLTSTQTVHAIVETAHLTGTEQVLEVGPGQGVMTRQLLKHARSVVAVEKDEQLAEVLEERFSEEIARGQLTVVRGDVLQCDPSQYGLLDGSYVIVANLPYYITGQFLRQFVSGTPMPALMVLLLQREVAERIICRDGKESLLSLSVQAYGEPRYIQKVKARDFSPPPQVDSAIIRIENISRERFYAEDEAHFFSVLHAGFAHKRKMLAGNLKRLYPNELVSSAFASCRLDSDVRPEAVDIDDWLCLAHHLSSSYDKHPS